MRNILILAFVFLTTFSFAQVDTTRQVINGDSVSLDPMFHAGTPESNELTLYGMNNSFRSAKLLQETVELTERLDLYRKKRNTRAVIGGGLMLAGLGGVLYVTDMQDPIYLTGDPNDPFIIENNQKADDQRDKRRMITYPSLLVGAIGSVVLIDSFKFNRWTKWELGMANIKVTQELYGLASHKRKYFTDQEEKLMKKKGNWPKYKQ